MTEVRLRDTRNNNNDYEEVDNEYVNLNNNESHIKKFKLKNTPTIPKKILKSMKNKPKSQVNSNINTSTHLLKRSRRNNSNHENFKHEFSFTKKMNLNNNRNTRKRKRIRKNYLKKRKINNVLNNNNEDTNTRENVEETLYNGNESGKKSPLHMLLPEKNRGTDLYAPNKNDEGTENNATHNTYDRRSEYIQPRNETADLHLGSSSNIIHGKNDRPNHGLNLSNFNNMEEVNLNNQKTFQNLPDYY